LRIGYTRPVLRAARIPSALENELVTAVARRAANA